MGAIAKEKRDKENQVHIDHLKTQKMEEVQSLYKLTQSIKGTNAERYLRNVRRVKTSELIETLRYIPANSSFTYGGKKRFVKEGALASIAQDKGGQVQAIQITYLDKYGNRARDAEGEKIIKVTYGAQKGSLVELQKGEANQPIYIAEGVETALSVKETGVKGSIYASLGTNNMTSLDVKGRDIMILADWDGSPECPAWKNTLTTQKALQEQGNNTTVVLPINNPLQITEKVDFNDVLTKAGVQAVSQLLEQSVPGENNATQPQNLSRENNLEDFLETSVKFKETVAHLEVLFSRLEDTGDNYEKERIMSKLDNKIKTLEYTGYLDKAYSVPQSVRESIESYKESKEETHSVGYSR